MQRRFLRKRGAAGVPAPPGGAVAQRLRDYKWRSEKSVKAIAPTGAALAFLCFDFFFRIVKGEQPLTTGCGTQHPLRALGGTRVLLAAAPTTPPCFRHWRRSSSLLRIDSGIIIFIFDERENLRIFPFIFFTRGVVTENGRCSAAFCESAARRACPLPRGELSRSD